MRSSLLSGNKRQFEESFYDCDDHLLSGNENVSSNFEELNNIITFHLESCKGPCNHDNTTDDNARMTLMIRLCILQAILLRPLILMMRMI